MLYFDLHTHSREITPDILAIHNVNPDELSGTEELPAPFSCGIHPWFITPGRISSMILQTESLLKHPACVAVGEAGIDKLCQTPMQFQIEAFQAMIRLSETYAKPLIIHCVKAWPELIALHKKSAGSQPWIIHGFRGNPLLAKQLTNQGFYLSFGKNHNTESLRQVDNERFFLETDEIRSDLSTLYQQAATLRGTTPDRLSKEINLRAKRLFGSDLFQNMTEK